MENSNLNILVVDDEQNVLKIVSDFLIDAGNTVYTANSGLKALQILEELPVIHLVITDLSMPEMNGIELLRKVKEISVDIEVIVLSAYSEAPLILSAMKEGAIDFIEKPFKMHELLSAVNNGLKKINEKFQQKENYEKIKSQNFELITYKALLEKRSGELFSKQLELKKANKTITSFNKTLKKKVAEQVAELTSKEVQATYGNLIQGIIHNMNSPLSVINGGLDILKMVIERDKGREQVDFDSYISRINKVSGAVKNLIKIVKNTMLRSRNENTAEKMQININDFIKQETDFLEANMFYKHEVQKEFNLAKDLPMIEAIYSDISQIFINIIQNALDAMWDSDEKKLTISTAYADNNIKITISDTGCGIDEKNIKKIFDIFFTTKPSTYSKEFENEPIGNGLGLHMVADIAKKNKIRIGVANNISSGVSFIILIPVADKNKEKAVSDQSSDFD